MALSTRNLARLVAAESLVLLVLAPRPWFWFAALAIWALVSVCWRRGLL